MEIRQLQSLNQSPYTFLLLNKPGLRLKLATKKAFVIPYDTPNQKDIEISRDRSEAKTTEAAIILNSSTHAQIYGTNKISNTLLASRV